MFNPDLTPTSIHGRFGFHAKQGTHSCTSDVSAETANRKGRMCMRNTLIGKAEARQTQLSSGSICKRVLRACLARQLSRWHGHTAWRQGIPKVQSPKSVSGNCLGWTAPCFLRLTAVSNPRDFKLIPSVSECHRNRVILHRRGAGAFLHATNLCRDCTFMDTGEGAQLLATPRPKRYRKCELPQPWPSMFCDTSAASLLHCHGREGRGF
jgi:hypothetical protein